MSKKLLGIIILVLLMGRVQAQTGKDYIVLFDNTGSYAKYFEGAKEFLVKLVKSLVQNDRFILMKIKSESFKDEGDGIMMEIPAKSSGMNLSQIREATLRKNKVIKAINEMRSSMTGKSDIIGSIYAAAEILENSERKEKFLIILSDMVDTGKDLGIFPTLSNVNVFVVMPRTETVEEHKILVKKWAKYFQRAKAKSFKIIDNVEAEEIKFIKNGG